MLGSEDLKANASQSKLVFPFNWVCVSIDIAETNSLCLLTKREVDQMQAYCMKCRTKREMKDPKAITMKNGKPATQGVCPVCGTKMFRIGKS